MQSPMRVGWGLLLGFFLINNFGPTQCKIKNLRQDRTVLYKHVIKFEIVSPPPSRVEIINLSVTKTTAHPL